MPPVDPKQMNIGDLIKSTIITTASLANALCDLTGGKQVLPESHYPELYGRYQHYLSKLIIAPRSAEDMNVIIRKFMQEIIDECNEPTEGEVENG